MRIGPDVLGPPQMLSEKVYNAGFLFKATWMPQEVSENLVTN